MTKNRPTIKIKKHPQTRHSVQIQHESNLRARIKRGQFPENRVVAFIDIIGFADLNERMFGAEPELFRTLLRALELTKSFADNALTGHLKSTRRHFSAIVEAFVRVATELARHCCRDYNTEQEQGLYFS